MKLRNLLREGIAAAKGKTYPGALIEGGNLQKRNHIFYVDCGTIPAGQKFFQAFQIPDGYVFRVEEIRSRGITSDDSPSNVSLEWYSTAQSASRTSAPVPLQLINSGVSSRTSGGDQHGLQNPAVLQLEQYFIFRDSLQFNVVNFGNVSTTCELAIKGMFIPRTWKFNILGRVA